MANSHYRGTLDTLAQSLAYRLLPEAAIRGIREWKHVRDLATVSEPEFPAIRPFVHRGDTVLDIGANFGVFTKFFADCVGSTGRVFSFEPIPITFRNLQKGIAHYHLLNVAAHNVAVSNRKQVVAMKIPQLATGGENLYEAEITPDGELEIPAITVDSLGLSPSFIKIDVEGHEREVLEGAKETLLRSRPALLVEVIHSEVIPFLSELGYQVRWTLRSNHLFSCNPQ